MHPFSYRNLLSATDTAGSLLTFLARGDFVVYGGVTNRSVDILRPRPPVVAIFHLSFLESSVNIGRLVFFQSRRLWLDRSKVLPYGCSPINGATVTTTSTNVKLSRFKQYGAWSNLRDCTTSYMVAIDICCARLG